MTDQAAKSWDAYASYQSDLHALRVEAQNSARQLSEQLVEELRAAMAGDDAAERSSAAWMKYQRDYSKRYVDYMKSCADRYRAYVESAGVLQAEANRAMLEGYIDFLTQLKAGTASAGMQPAMHS